MDELVPELTFSVGRSSGPILQALLRFRSKYTSDKGVIIVITPFHIVIVLGYVKSALARR